MIRRRRLAIFVMGLMPFGFFAERVFSQQPPAVRAPSPPDGLLRSELSLMGKTVTLAFSPSLKGDGTASLTQVARLTTTGSLLVGSIALGKEDPAGVSYDLTLRSTASGWQLEAADGQGTVAGQTELSRQAAASASPTFVAALIPATENSASILMRWGAYEATTTVQFTDRPRRRLTEQSRPNQTTSRTHDEDTSVLSRARLLAQRNETAVILPKGQRVSVSFIRAFSRQERTAAAAAENPGLSADGPDFARLASTANGSVVQLTESAVPRLRIETPLRFGQTNVATGNQGPGFPGAYGIWLKRVGGGWRLVLNNEPDAWGSQHDPKFDAAEIPLTHSESQAAMRPFAVSLVPTAPNRGRLAILWGPHEWTADFAVAN